MSSYEYQELKRRTISIHLLFFFLLLLDTALVSFLHVDLAFVSKVEHGCVVLSN